MESRTAIRRHINAPRDAVYRALLDPDAVASWMIPDGMSAIVHTFEPREGGSLRISLTYDEPTALGKTTSHTDTYHGRFVELVPNERVVEVMEFETDDQTMRGEMTVTLSLTDADGGTEVHALHENLPAGLSVSDNDLGWQMALDKLAALAEAGRSAFDP